MKIYEADIQAAMIKEIKEKEKQIKGQKLIQQYVSKIEFILKGEDDNEEVKEEVVEKAEKIVKKEVKGIEHTVIRMTDLRGGR